MGEDSCTSLRLKMVNLLTDASLALLFMEVLYVILKFTVRNSFNEFNYAVEECSKYGEVWRSKQTHSFNNASSNRIRTIFSRVSGENCVLISSYISACT